MSPKKPPFKAPPTAPVPVKPGAKPPKVSLKDSMARRLAK